MADRTSSHDVDNSPVRPSRDAPMNGQIEAFRAAFFADPRRRRSLR